MSHSSSAAYQGKHQATSTHARGTVRLVEPARAAAVDMSNNGVYHRDIVYSGGSYTLPDLRNDNHGASGSGISTEPANIQVNDPPGEIQVAPGDDDFSSAPVPVPAPRGKGRPRGSRVSCNVESRSLAWLGWVTDAYPSRLAE